MTRLRWTVVVGLAIALALVGCGDDRTAAGSSVLVAKATLETGADKFLSVFLDEYHVFQLRRVGDNARLVFTIYVDGTIERESIIPMEPWPERGSRQIYTAYYAVNTAMIDEAVWIKYGVGWANEGASSVTEMTSRVTHSLSNSEGYYVDGLTVEPGQKEILYYRAYTGQDGGTLTTEVGAEDRDLGEELSQKIQVSQRVEVLEFAWRDE